MKNELIQLHDLAEKIKSLGSVEIEELDLSDLEYFIEQDGNYSSDRWFSSFVQQVKDGGIELSEKQQVLCYLSIDLFWARWEQISNEGVLFGGMHFHGFTGVLDSGSEFSEDSMKTFLKYESEDKTDLELISELKYIESPKPPLLSYTPQFGCVKLKTNALPNEFYFYDSGLVYELPFSSYEDYINGILASAAIVGWQYFFVNPKEIISKNHGVDYMTWSMHVDNTLDEKLKELGTHYPDAKYDRLDMIASYLERCIKLLPPTFSFLNFENHKKHYEEFKSLYDNFRKKK